MAALLGQRRSTRSPALFVVLLLLYPSCGRSATITVSTLQDGRGAGTLRAAIRNSAPGDTIVFKRGLRGTIALTNGGALLIRKNLTIRGPGAGIITVSGRTRTRVFSITNANVTISGLTIANGRVAGKQGTGTNSGAMAFGAAILNLNSAPDYEVTLEGCSFVRNTVRGGDGGSLYWGNPGEGGDAYGGAIFNNGRTTINRCTFYANIAAGGRGGGSRMGGKPGGNAAGAAICNVGVVTLTNCTFGMNLARGGGGGGGGGDFFQGSGGTAEGGAVYTARELVIVSCTISSNTTVGGESDSIVIDKTGGAYGGGVRNAGEGCDIRNTIVAGNAGRQAPDASGGFLSSGFNLVGDTNGSTGFGVSFDLVGNASAPLNAMLSAMENGPMRVFPLQAGSPALDAGSGFGVTTDQHGTARPSDLPTIVNANDGTDVGAFELPISPLALQ